MSLLLMSKTAKQPFYCEQLNIRLFSLEELAYCIYSYPLLALDGLVGDRLIGWIRADLGEEYFAGELEQQKKAGESQENMLLEILQRANYFTIQEIRSFRNLILEYRKLPAAELFRETGRTCFRAGRYYPAEEKFLEAVRELTVSLAKANTEPEIRRLKEQKADVYCDLAAVRMLRFDEAGAMRYIGLAEETGRCSRAGEYRYLISGRGDLPEEEKQALEEKRCSLTRQAAESPLCRKVRELSGLDREAFIGEAADIVREWKKEYRKTS